MTNTTAVKKPRPEGHLSGFQVLAGLAFGVGAVWFMASSGSGGSDDQESSVKPTPFMAFIQCQAFVKNTLKAPATAQFPSKPQSAIDAGNNTFVVIATVDAQNSFGALLRNDWTCKTRYTGGHPASPGSWVMESVSLD
jgi:hypothetical protein